MVLRCDLAFPNITTFTEYDTSTNALFDATTPASLKTQAGNPNLKVMGAFGGWNQDLPFRPNVQTPELRQAFAAQIVQFMDTFNLYVCEI